MLATPLTLPCGVTLHNRIAKSAMTEAMADRADHPTNAHATLYKRWGDGGFGLLMTGNVMIDSRYLERPGNVVAEDETVLPSLTAWANAVKPTNAALFMQISHPGRQCPAIVNRRPLAPSAERLRILGVFGTPRAMSENDIADTIARYAATARLAKRAGFDGVQLHAAHGYLLSQFLSPNTNRRSDQWGGSLENRARFLRATLAATRAGVGPAFPIAVKLNSADFQKGGFTLEDSMQVARWLEEDGIDLIEISGGTYEQMSFLEADTEGQRDSTKRREAFFLDYAREIRAAVSVPLMVTGGFRHRAAMQEALATHGIDLIGLARPACTDPDCATRLLSGEVDQIGIDESGLMLGRGPLGANAKGALAGLVNAVARVEYYVWQMMRMGRGQAPDASGRANALGYLMWYLTRSARVALARKLPGA
ncbi:NADH:flavin oxidoreductase/NADH oxidase family protein [Shimia aestuarii]|uniref:NADH:flavin oxidoreductase/NADH oxidase family protein n=1 Tax=Shimia aestuarii TaxID=254406 RepID=UPI001FB39A00|nr:NADH:flavin oxidoreductase/NADH oxidase family protein [Shimia aestuarii]